MGKVQNPVRLKEMCEKFNSEEEIRSVIN